MLKLLLLFHLLFLLIKSETTLLEILGNSLSNCNLDSKAFLRADPDNSDNKCITFKNYSVNGDLYCGNFATTTGKIELCFDYFGKKLTRDEDSGGFIGLFSLTNNQNIWFAGASSLNQINSQSFYYLDDTNSWNNYCIKKQITANSQYKLALMDYQHAGGQSQDSLFKNIVIKEIDKIDPADLEKQKIQNYFSSNDFINEINLNFTYNNSTQQFLFELSFPNIKSQNTDLSYLNQQIYLITGSTVKSFIPIFNPQSTITKIKQTESIVYEQFIDLDEFKGNEDSQEGYTCNITNNIKTCKGVVYFYYDDGKTTDRQQIFLNCQKEALLTYNFILRVNLTNNGINNQNSITLLQQISKIPCSDSDCTALIGQGKETNISYFISMCTDESETCTERSSNKLLWSQYAIFQVTSSPAIRFKVHKAYIYLPDYTNSSTGEGVEIKDFIVKTHDKYGLLKFKYQVSSQASLVGTQVSLKFVLKQKGNSTKRNLEDEKNSNQDDDNYNDGVASVDLANVEVLDENQTQTYLSIDEEFEIMWLFYPMIGLFFALIALNVLMIMVHNKQFKVNNAKQPEIQNQA